MKAVFNELRWIEAISGELVVIEYNLSSVGVKQAASIARDMHVFQLIQVPGSVWNVYSPPILR
jgi:hypothetical protein